MPVSVGDRDGEGGRLIGHDEIGHMPTELQSPKAVLGEQAGDHDKTEHHREEQVKQVVAGIYSREPDPECEEKKPSPLRGETNRPPSGHAPDEGNSRGGIEVEEWLLHACGSSN